MSEQDDYIDELMDLISQGITSGKTMEATLGQYRRLMNVPEQLLEQARIRYESAVGIIRAVQDPAAVMSEATRRATWYAGPKSSDSFWPGVERRLSETLPQGAIESIDAASSKVLSVMSPPGAVEFATRGLVLGYVQSGKTTSFISVVAKAADRGYRVFIVLSGITDNLRSQTQRRIDKVLLGSDAKAWIQLTTADSDFAEASDNAANLLRTRDLRFIAVVKKNPARLRKLRDWLKAAGPGILAGAPILVIDDEADQASIDVSAAAGRTSAINGLLLEILEQPKAAYVAYTATPFANLLIDPHPSRDLYPRDFIVPLPQSPDYFGSERMFGKSEPMSQDDPVNDGMDVSRTIDVHEALLIRPPKGKGAVYSWTPEVGEALSDSIRWFFLSTAARRVRGASMPHATMLIHTSMLAEAHRRVAEAVCVEIQRMNENLVSIRGDEWTKFEALYSAEVARVSASEFSHTLVSFGELRDELLGVLSRTQVIIDNYLSADRLNYDNAAPSTAIVIGGNTLSRGLTLEGLTSSYFVRSASAYDTLLQMGRWFGYREGYEDLCRVWMTAELNTWFRDLSLVEAEIRGEILKYEMEGLSPSEVAVRIRKHPDMTVTAAAKMRKAVVAQMSYSATRPQTILFSHKNALWLQQNLQAVRSLVETMKRSGRLEREFPSGRRGFANVDSADLVRFIGEYNFHPDGQRLRREYVTDYICQENAANSLLKWNVVFMEGGRSEKIGIDFGLTSLVYPLQRSQMADSRDGTANLKAIASTIDRAADLDLDPQEVVRRALRFGAKVTDAALVQIRQSELPDIGLLCIYPIDRASVPAQANSALRRDLNAVEDLVGLTFFFPHARGVHSQVDYVAADMSGLLNEDEDEEREQASQADLYDFRTLEEQS